MKQFVYISLLSFFFVGISANAQTRKQLENRRKKLEREIKKIEKILSQTNREKTNAIDDLRDFNNKIATRKKLIETIELEKNAIVKEINTNQATIKKNNSDLKALKADYADMVFKSYKSKSEQSKMMFLLSSNNFYQAYKRLKYMEQYKDFRKKQGNTIVSKTKLVEALNDSLKKIEKQKTQLIATKEKENKAIEKDIEEQERLVSNIKKQERKFRNRLQFSIRKEKQITKQIEDIIANAIEKANAGKKAKSKKELVLSKEELNLKAKFEQNKGKLPSPIAGGIVTRRFGVQAHPTFKKVKINSTGVHIACEKGDDAKTVFNGKVLVVQLLSKGRKSVFIQHGDYITTYTNLEEVYVSAGDKVKTGDVLGRVFTNKITGKTSLQFILSKNTQKLNPQDWVRI